MIRESGCREYGPEQLQKRESFERMTLGEIRRRPTLPGRFQPSTISVLRLNFCVRDGNRWIPQAIVTGNLGFQGPCPLRFRSPFALALLSLRLRSGVPSASLPFPRTLKTAQVRFRLRSPDHGALRYSLRHSLSFAQPSVLSSALSSVSLLASLSFQIILPDQALDRLVSPSSIHYCTSTDDLSTLSSSRGLTCF